MLRKNYVACCCHGSRRRDACQWSTSHVSRLALAECSPRQINAAQSGQADETGLLRQVRPLLASGQSLYSTCGLAGLLSNYLGSTEAGQRSGRDAGAPVYAGPQYALVTHEARMKRQLMMSPADLQLVDGGIICAEEDVPGEEVFKESLPGSLKAAAIAVMEDAERRCACVTWTQPAPALRCAPCADPGADLAASDHAD